jgi:hypothetical protein
MKWEYLIIKMRGNLEKASNTLGNEGWELVTVENDIAYFKRPKDIAIRELSIDDKVGIKKAIEGYFGGKVG